MPIVRKEGYSYNVGIGQKNKLTGKDVCKKMYLKMFLRKARK